MAKEEEAKEEPVARDLLDELLAFKDLIDAELPNYPDRIKYNLVNLSSQLSGLADTMRVEEHLYKVRVLPEPPA